ncbi:hypothetical protein [Leptobacterium sp. I13]|uniref:hypothetical protein n=1 Tax=Leptobacterium meishanense TaxID=3128904 RepID=UPI0030EDE5D6
MKKKFLSLTTLMASCLFALPLYTNAQAFIDLESGAVFTGSNNVRIPGDTGTLFSLKKNLDTSSTAFIRVSAGYTFRSRHTISLLYAPLTVKSNGLINTPIDFEGVTFSSNTTIAASYRFNSYRLTYRYDIIKNRYLNLVLDLPQK